jgi:hypothetical protein
MTMKQKGKEKAKGHTKKRKQHRAESAAEKGELNHVFGVASIACLSVLFVVAFGFCLYFLQVGAPSRALWCGVASVVFATLGIAFYIEGFVLRPKTIPAPELHGLLIPANDPRPILKCPFDVSEDVVVLLGSFTLATKKEFTGVEIYGQKLLSLKKTDAGITVSARVISSNNKVVAQITDNEFYVNPSQYFRMERAEDWHTLRVIDGEGAQVLYVRYMNPTTIKVLGSFYTPNGPATIVTEEKLTVGMATFRGGCARGDQGAAIGDSGSPSP